ncbi:hypothetical protein N9R29_00150 [Gammaproteobacteria bacterium]|nr:hypothetical protein [Gammaproteobacteria bacterium]MDC1268129.1 hypothetical protein [Gammaproteobacteria bacterium]
MGGSSNILALVFDGAEYPPPSIAVRNTINLIPKDPLQGYGCFLTRYN